MSSNLNGIALLSGNDIDKLEYSDTIKRITVSGQWITLTTKFGVHGFVAKPFTVTHHHHHPATPKQHPKECQQHQHASDSRAPQHTQAIAAQFKTKEGKLIVKGVETVLKVHHALGHPQSQSMIDELRAMHAKFDPAEVKTVLDSGKCEACTRTTPITHPLKPAHTHHQGTPLQQPGKHGSG